MMVLVGLLGFAQAQNNSNDTRKAPRAANPTEQRGSGGPGGPNRQPAKTALESDCYSDADSDQAIALFELIDRLCGDYAIDRDRLYNTGAVNGWHVCPFHQHRPAGSVCRLLVGGLSVGHEGVL